MIEAVEVSRVGREAASTAGSSCTGKQRQETAEHRKTAAFQLLGLQATEDDQVDVDAP
jgi:hypothetical protein